jgi:hypothetical protein
MELAYGSPFLGETEALTKARESIRTLLGPRPQLNTILGSCGIGDPQYLDAQRNALIAYRAKIIALIWMLEGGVKAPGNGPILRPVGGNYQESATPTAASRAPRKRHLA